MYAEQQTDSWELEKLNGHRQYQNRWSETWWPYQKTDFCMISCVYLRYIILNPGGSCLVSEICRFMWDNCGKECKRICGDCCCTAAIIELWGEFRKWVKTIQKELKSCCHSASDVCKWRIMSINMNHKIWFRLLLTCLSLCIISKVLWERFLQNVRISFQRKEVIRWELKSS